MNLKPKTYNLQPNGGFTLMELLVSVTIFAVVVTIASSIFISTIGSQRKAFGQQNILDSSRFALESMARAIRQSDVISATVNTLEINHPDKGTIQYSLSGGQIMESGGALTADDVTVESLTFLTDGLAGNDNEQPRVTIILQVSSKNVKAVEQTSITIQTTITPRNLQIQ